VHRSGRWLALLALALGCAGCKSSSEADAGQARSDAASAPAPGPSAAAPTTSATASADLSEKAAELAQRLIIVDGHIDVPWRLWKSRDAKGNVTEDVGEATEHGDFDYPRAVRGGLDAPFMSIYVPAKYEAGGAKKMADSLIDLVEGIAAKHPGKFAVARSTAEVRANASAGRLSLLLGMENGSPIERKLENVTHFFDRGIRYITLAHSKDNHISDSSYDDRHTHKGLSAFGEKVVVEMNRLGIMVDVSHVTDDAFYDVLQISTAPVIASHSSCRKFTPGWARNMSDEMIRALAAKGGVIQINFGSGFLDAAIREQHKQQRSEVEAVLRKKGLGIDQPQAKPFIEELDKQHPIVRGTVEQVADHIDHVKQLVGVDHVGLGSDFDGVGPTLPKGLEDVSRYPNLIRVLLQRGWTEPEIEKLCSGNVLRVWEAVEKSAAASRVESTPAR
jgi:membrane dipeptidase